jgi:tetratricopeptide (TPR) repeat protein
MAKGKPRNARVETSTPVPPGGLVAAAQGFFSGKNGFALYLLVFAVTLAVFLPSLRNDFQSWYGDDPLYVTKNPHVNTGLTWTNVTWALTSIENSNWHPLTWMSHMLDCELYGLKPWGHHLTSVLLHAFNATLLLLVLRRMTGSTWRSFVVTILFALHPLRAESVAWVAERKDVLSAFFWMLTLLMYVRYAQGRGMEKKARYAVWYSLALLAFALGLLSKAMVVTLPCVLLLLDYWPLRRLSFGSNNISSEKTETPVQQFTIWRLLIEKVPFIVLVVMTSLLTYITQQKWGFLRTYNAYPMDARIGNALVSYVRYLKKMFWPADLCSFYPHPGTWPLMIVVVAAAILVAISIVTFLTRRNRPYIAVGWLWYLGTLVPVIGIVQLADQAMADRYTYIPMIGILIAVVWGVHEVTCRFRIQPIAWTIGVVAVLLPCTILTQQHIGHFKNGVTRWQHNLAVTRDIGLARYALGLSLDDAGRHEEAIGHLQVVLKDKWDRADVHRNIATMYERLGQREEAMKHYREALRLEPGFTAARYNLVVNLIAVDNFDEAIVHLRQMVKHSPNDAVAYNALGASLAQKGELNEAIDAFEKALKITPDNAEAHHNVGISLMDSGRKEEAIRHFEEALRLDPSSTESREYLEALKQMPETAP